MFAVIDIETNGGSSVRDRITEVAIIVHDGKERIDEFSTLINPGQFIPSYITDITGIDDEMVAFSPTFREVASKILELTKGCVFVAHNVGFDYGFIQQSFLRLGVDFQRHKLCTVKASRKLIPGLRSYSLGKLCAQLGITIQNRHRALGDTEATVQVLEELLSIEPDLLAMALPQDPYKDLPAEIDRKLLDQLPERPGMYFLADATGKTVYASNSKNIRRDALRRLKDKKKNSFSPEEVRDLSWEVTGNELLAMLRLSKEIELRAPEHVSGPKPKKFKTGVFGYHDQRNHLRLYIGPLRKGQTALAEFGNHEDAAMALVGRVKKHGLCPVLAGIEEASCDGTACNGACQGTDDAQEYNRRVGQALEGIGFPYPSFFVLDQGRSQGEVSVVCVQNGSCLGYAYLDAGQSWKNPDLVMDLLQPFTQPDSGARIVRQFLPKMKEARIVPF